MNKSAKSPLPPTLHHIKGPEDFAAAFDVPRETVEKLTLYAALLDRWQKAVNLVSQATLNDVWHRHFADSAQLLKHAPDAKSWVDLGSGGGFPGLVIAILCTNHENCIVHLVESNGRKCAFLSDVARQTGVRVRVHQQRIEVLAKGDTIGSMDVVSGRALAPLGRLLGLASGFFDTGTTGMFLKGREAGQEIDDASAQWHFDHRILPSRTNQDGCIVEVKNLISQGDISR
jgi:16S rRNA (guanine527-N7)-methyltransferase